MSPTMVQITWARKGMSNTFAEIGGLPTLQTEVFVCQIRLNLSSVGRSFNR